MPTFSVIVPARNAAQTLQRQLDALADQTASVDWELIVADNGSTDGTRAVADSFVARLGLTIVDASGARGAAGTRNAGARHAQGDVLLFTDADDVVSPDWVAAHADAGHEHATGPTPAMEGAGTPAWGSDEFSRTPPTLLQFLPYAPGTNLAVSRGRFESLGGFDELMAAGEDVDLSWRAQLGGVSLGFVDGAVVAVDRGRAATGQLHRYRRYGQFDVELYKRFRAAGAPPMNGSQVARSYLGMVARAPLTWRRDSRSKFVRQLGRRLGRLTGSLRHGVIYL